MHNASCLESILNHKPSHISLEHICPIEKSDHMRPHAP